MFQSTRKRLTMLAGLGALALGGWALRRRLDERVEIELDRRIVALTGPASAAPARRARRPTRRRQRQRGAGAGRQRGAAREGFRQHARAGGNRPRSELARRGAHPRGRRHRAGSPRQREPGGDRGPDHGADIAGGRRVGAPASARYSRWASQAAAEGQTALRGKSGHHRARWSGHRPGETRGKVPQKHTADGAATRESRTGKVEMVR
jgi:hypothetical protein